MFEVSISMTQARVPVAIMRLKGSLDAACIDEFDAQAEEVVAGGAKEVLVDLSELKFISSTGFRSLNNLFYQLHPQDSEEYQRILKEGVRNGTYKAPHFKLLNPSKEIAKTLATAGMDMYIDILYGSETDAIGSF